MAFRLATWNVNSLKVRLPHLLDWLAATLPDAVCLQETKTEDANFPRMELEAAGDQAVFCEVSFDVTDKLTLTGGARHFKADNGL